jgi:hypothetical protein
MTTPYLVAARDYLESGWSPIPLPHEQKGPVPDQFPAGTKVSFTGGEGIDVTAEHVRVWCGKKGRANAGKLSYPPSNIALRLPRRADFEILGVDVDAYDTKKGAETFAKAELAWGALPPTWVSTSRDDEVSGIRFYRVPPGLAWPGELPQGKGVELIRWDHRYAIVAPSVHDKTKAPYRWAREVVDGSAEGGAVVFEWVEDEIPDVAEIVAMPKEWVEGLTSGAAREDRATSDEIGADEVRRWIAERNDPEAPCRHMRKMLTRWSVQVQKAADDGGAHEEMRDAIWGALNDARSGHAGLGKILTRLRNTFLQAVQDRRPDEGSARSEWARAVIRGANKVMSDGNDAEEEDPCGLTDSVGGPGQGGSGSAGGSKGSAGATGSTAGGLLGSDDIEVELNDLGNANRLVRVMGGRARWIDVHGCWYVWDDAEGRWREDVDGQVERWTVKAMVQIEEEAALLANGENGEALVKAWMAHRKSSLKVGALGAAREMAKTRKGIRLPAEKLDADPKLLGTPDGILVLGGGSLNGESSSNDSNARGVEVLHRNGEWARDRWVTMRTAVPLVRSARGGSVMWSEFLKRFQPDEEVRDWLQRITGYSLLGSNPDRLIIVQRGPTSSGKSTFAAAIQTVLGDYAGPMPASVLRRYPAASSSRRRWGPRSTSTRIRRSALPAGRRSPLGGCGRMSTSIGCRRSRRGSSPTTYRRSKARTRRYSGACSWCRGTSRSPRTRKTHSILSG